MYREHIIESSNILEKDIENIDKKIRRASQKSKKGPQEFIEPELRRFVNLRWLLLGPEKINNAFFDYAIEEIEQDYLCYFETEKYKSSLWPTGWWQFTYAGCNNQIERFLIENDIGEALQKLGFTEQFDPVCEMPKKELPKSILRYFIGIGYLYPSGKNVIVHPNMLIGQQRRATYSADSPFLSRDLIRCPYHSVLNDWGSAVNEEKNNSKLSDKELWGYWGNLVALTFGGLPEFIHYKPSYFKNQKSIKNKDLLYHLQIGKRLVPKRYTQLEPEIEKFEWNLIKE